MAEWTGLLGGIDPGELVPPAYAAYRPAVSEGLGFFLASIAPDRALAILAGQAALPAGAGIAERLVAVARHCPALHKLGQVLARDRRLPPGLRRWLQRLESMPATQTGVWVRQTLEQELGPLARLGITLDKEPLAEASVAVVMPFAWQEGTGSTPRRGVFKLLKPGIEARLEEDLAALQDVGALLDDRCQRLGIPAIDYAETFARVRDLLCQEIRLDREQANLTAAGAAYAGVPHVIVPEIYPLSTARVTAMQRIDGSKVTDCQALPANVRRRLAGLIVEALLARPVWSAEGTTMFHADPHAGNLLATADGRLAILDWSLVGHLSKDQQTAMTQILIGAATLDAGRIHRAIAALAVGGADGPALAAVVDGGIARLQRDPWPGLGWLTWLLDEAVVAARARFAADLVMFRKVLHTLQGVVADVSESCRIDSVLARSMLTRVGVESGWRTLAPPFSHAFASHVSNAEITHVLASAPLILLRALLRLTDGTSADGVPAVSR